MATDCPSGPAEILEDVKHGQLIPVDNPAALALALLRSLNGTFHMPHEILKARAEDFTVEKAVKHYMDTLLGKI